MYRRELDGLRALAVFAVIIYHAGIELGGVSLVPGGFLGVDVFFVLSGYLITGIVLHRQTSLLSFYKKRVDRIYPALLLLLLLVALTAHWLLQPSSLEALARSARGALGFYSNYVFMAEDSYVSASSHYKPLLHTWSLGVEWQYYLLFPLLLYPVRGLATAGQLAILGLCTLISFGYCLYLLELDQTRAFYSTPARVWELFAGGLVHLLQRRCQSVRYQAIWAGLGLLLILAALVVFRDTDPHPGFVSLVAVSGTALFILFTCHGSVLHRFFASRPLVFAGVLSYSLYLYHQPVLVFYRIRFAEVSPASLLMLLPLMLLLAWLSYRLFENPLRRSQRHSKYLLLAALLALLWAYYQSVVARQGYPERQPEHIRQALQHFQGPEWTRLTGDTPGMGQDGTVLKTCSGRTPATACRFGEADPELIIVGDSFAGVFSFAIHQHAAFNLLTLHHGECPLLADPIWFGGQPGCWNINQQRMALLASLKPATVLVAASYLQFDKAKQSRPVFQPGEPNLDAPVPASEVHASFRKAILQLIDMGHYPVIVLQPPRPNLDVEMEMKRLVAAGTLRFNPRRDGTPTFDMDASVRDTLVGLTPLTFISLNQALCDSRQQCLTFSEQGGLYNRGPHLSFLGVQQVMDQIVMAVQAGPPGQATGATP